MHKCPYGYLVPSDSISGFQYSRNVLCCPGSFPLLNPIGTAALQLIVV
eukprot:SAG31_NODE_37436_length_304_cov_0.800000_1_plen_47_part_10